MTATSESTPSEFASHWALDPDVTYLNHGSFGACPTTVLEAQHRYRAQMEAEAVRFFVEDIYALLDRSRDRLSRFVGADPAGLVFVRNATEGVTTALSNFPLEPGDEIIACSHEYPACQNNVRSWAERRGARVIAPTLPFPVAHADELHQAVLEAVTDRTRLCLLSHATSPTALVLPITRIVADLRERGVETILDAAHGPGFRPLHLDAVGAAYATGNCHKWLCTPKGAAFLSVREDLRDACRPIVLSNSAEHPDAGSATGRSFFQHEFDYVGTDDRTAWLAIDDAIDFLDHVVPGGIEAVMDRIRALCLRGRDILCRRLGIEAPVPDDLLGPMATLLLPPHPDERARALAQRPTRHHDALQDALIDRHGIQVPIWTVPGSEPGLNRTVRISAHLYNDESQYEALADALIEELERERAL